MTRGSRGSYVAFHADDNRVVLTNVEVYDHNDIQGIVNIELCAAVDGENFTSIGIRSTTSSSVLFLPITGEQRRKLIEALLEEQEKYD